MTEIKIPFLKRFEKPMLNGTKTRTARTKRYGHKGDTFPAFGAWFTLTVEPFQQPLAKIADEWKSEGCMSYGDFLAVWKQIHPQRLVDFDEHFWVHQFRKSDTCPACGKLLSEHKKETIRVFDSIYLEGYLCEKVTTPFLIAIDGTIQEINAGIFDTVGSENSEAS